jgi:hypothetical protein
VIGVITMASGRLPQDFMDDLTAKVDNLQAEGYHVEVQYASVMNGHTALVIGRVSS